MGHLRDTDKNRLKYSSQQHRDPTVKAKLTQPSIPAKKFNANSYTGKGEDTVGPCLYNPTLSQIRKGARAGDFAASKTTRTVF